ncbi:MAG: hypothetical protein LBC53_02885 [Spirochaetaceae bacterium]|jgi:hypothetical protein|nr:hypothetical protein [Spirochaetaceae bacterium]
MLKSPRKAGKVRVFQNPFFDALARFFRFWPERLKIQQNLVFFKAAVFYALIFSTMFLTSCPVLEPPHTASIRGKIIYEKGTLPISYEIKRVHIYTKDQEYLGSADVNEKDDSWESVVTSEDGVDALFWVEMISKRDVYYNSGNIEKITDGMYYELYIDTITEGAIVQRPILSPNDLQNIGKDELHPADGSYILIHNIDITAPWKPIDSVGGAEPFNGKLNGRNNVINVRYLPGGTNLYSGIFARISGKAKIQNLKINVEDVGVSFDTQNNQAFGVLAGCIEGGTLIENVELSGTKLICTRNGISEFYAGGIAGIMKDDSVIKNTVVNLNIIVNVTSPSLTAYAGGVAGIIDDNAKIEQCYTSGNIQASNKEGGAASGGIAGGIAGGVYIANESIYPYPSIQIKNSCSHSTVSSSGETSFAGGIAGLSAQSPVNIENCYSAGNISAVTITDKTYAYAGGILGLSEAQKGNKISGCAIFASTISISAKSGVLFAGFTNGVTEYQCIDCLNSNSICLVNNNAGGNTGPKQMECGCENKMPGGFHFLNNMFEEKCVFTFNGKPRSSTENEACNDGEMKTKITWLSLFEIGWDFDNIWMWKPNMLYPDLLLR